MSATFRHIVRVADTDLPGDVSLAWGLAQVKGVGYNMSLAVCRVLNLDPNMPVGFLTDEDVENIEKVLRDPKAFGIPTWMLNRRKDPETSNDVHLVSSDLIYYVRQDIEREIKIRSWRGVRHALGYKVRGQRTHTTGRVGPVVGVQRKKTAQQKEER